ncbi:zinc finger protein 595-like isoform X2 [Ceratina calcarata]|uniref:Zinc finger protein 595-like isoform X2 n=1 Tax=Ceratina calcarata TaxID=156304 RepID=A0AAJ7WBP2_9HYME|nr:zinc finger protein 595-like isoform X2 [Ceratina calcarata]
MEAQENEQFVSFPLSDVHDDVDSNITEGQVAVEILSKQSDEEDDNRVVYPIYIKEEEPQQYTSGDDESMAVEALRQLGGMYPCFEDKKVACTTCTNHFTQTELAEHHETCADTKLSCITCGERFERKIDLNNHIVCHQVDRPHACRTCGNLFRSKSNLRCHMLQVHQVERPHKCNICGADFQRPSSLSNHMKIHTYVAGRAIMHTQGVNESQSEETFKKWPENITESQNSGTVESYDAVQWTVPSYNFPNEQTTINAISDTEEKIDTLSEFTVMPNGEVTQFEYSQQNNISNQQYTLSLNSFNNADTMVKVKPLSYNSEVEANDSKRHTCKHCGVSFSRATALVSHEKIHAFKNWNMPIECEYCDKQFQDANHLATHQTTCGKKLMQHGNAEQGMANNKWCKHACSECGKKFTTKQKMFRHQWIHRKKTHSCEVCGSQFEKQNELDEHRLSAHPGDSPFTCTECGKSFVSRQGLWEHGRTHAGSPAHFHCDTCSKTFSSRQGYLIHHRTHTGERPYGCKFCWKAFRDGGTLRKHERIHTGERPHVCPLCSRAFNQKVVLREHVRWVHAAGKNDTEITGPPFPCSLCGALNQDRDELCAHIVKHSDQMIAEAKAKTINNATKPKTKKLKTCTNAQAENNVTSGENSIAESERSDDIRNDTFLVVTTEKRALDITTHNEITTMHLIQTSKQPNTFHLISKQNDSLPVLTLPNPQGHDEFSSQIAQISNNDLSMDIVNTKLKRDVKDETEEQSLVEEGPSQTVIQVLHYNEEDSDNEDLVCGICGEEFKDKKILMEHVKIHI